MHVQPITRSRLRDEIVDRLARMIVDGELGDERLKEVELATRLGVSRTPLREALLVLERDGLVVSEVNKGFRVAALSERRVRELYPILGTLEGLAVRESGPLLRPHLAELRAVNAELRASKTRAKRHALDRRFHELLCEPCPNRSLVEMVRSLWLHAQRFDGAADRGMAEPAGSLREHIAITDAIAGGDYAGAAGQLDEHWRHGVDVVVRWLRARSTTLGLVAVLALATASACRRTPPAAPLDDATWGYFLDEAKIDLLVEGWSKQYQPRALAIEHVSVVTLADDAVAADQTVVVADGIVRAIGAAGSVAVPHDALVVDGRGRYVMPGRVDMHTHTNLSDSHYILDLANGVTSIREMDGLPYLLHQRTAARANRLLIPNLYVAGHILASRPLAWYATVVTTPEAARAAVRAQKAAGYEFIKVHNMVLPAVYDAICAEARAQGLDVVGHIPHDISIAHAIACPQRTFEHFKGYINDRDLQLTTEDYVAVTRGAEVWNTPTFYTYRTHLRGQAARDLVATAPEMRYVAARERARWLALAAEPAKPVQQNVRPLSEKIFRDLRANVRDARFLAGTDSGGGYPYHVPGFSLHEELRMMASYGMPIGDVLRTATVEPARAMRRSELGALAVGKRADLLVLDGNPLATLDNLERIAGVVVRGVWLPRDAIDRMLGAIAEVARGAAQPPTRSDLDRAVTTLEALRARGYVLREHFLGWLKFRLAAAHVAVDRPLFTGIEPLAPDED